MLFSMSLWQRTFLWFGEQDSRHTDSGMSLPRACSFTDRNDLSGVCPASFTVRCRYVLNRGRLTVSTGMSGCHIRARRMTDIEQMEATWDRHPQHKSTQSN